MFLLLPVPEDIAAQEEPSPPEFHDRLDIVEAELRVVVRDADGRPVSGLGREEFLVMEDGNRRPITTVAEHSPPEAKPSQRPAAEPPVNLDSRDERPTLVFFLDYAALDPIQASRTVRSIEQFLSAEGAEGSPPPWLVLATLDRGLSFPILPTSAVAHFLGQLENLPPPPAWSAQRRLERQRAAEEIGGNQRAGSCTDRREVRIRSELTQYIAEVSTRNAHSIAGLRALLTVLGGVKGPVIVLYIGSGPEVEPGQEMIERAENACPGKRFTSYAGEAVVEDLRDVVAFANAQGISLYGFDAEGTRTADDSIASKSPGPAMSARLRSLRAQNTQQSLVFLARETGGRAFLNTVDIGAALSNIESDNEHYYILSYVPATRRSGTDRVRVDVELLGEENQPFEVRHRRSFVHLDLQQELVASLLAALWLGREEAGLQVKANLLESAGASDALTVRISIPFSDLVLEPDRARTAGISVRLFLMAMEPEGPARTPPRHETRHFSGQEVEHAEEIGHFEFLVELDELPGGTYDLAVGVRDETTSRFGVRLLEGLLVGDRR